MKHKGIILFLLVLLLLGSVVPAAFASPANQQPAAILVVNTSFLNARAGDGPQFAVVATLVGGQEVGVLGTNSANTWYLVQTPAGPGWVDVSFTLPRGDFSAVPVVKPAAPVPGLPGAPLSIGAPPSSGSIPTGTTAGVNVTTVNLRTAPADDAPVIGIIFRYDLTDDLPVVGQSRDSKGVLWVAVVHPDLGTGWIEQNKVTLHGPTPTSTAQTVTSGSLQAPHVIVNTGYQNIRVGPGPQFAIIATVPGGTSLEAIGVNSDATWYLVRGPFGQGWIASQFVIFRGTFSNLPVLHTTV